ncbi:MAG TPA: amidase [Actinomycetota bacterium]
MPSRRDVLRAGVAGAGAWLGGLRVAELLAAVPDTGGTPFTPSSGGAIESRDDLAYLTIAQASRMIAAGEITPTDLVEACLARVERHDPTIQAYLELTARQARAEAADATAEIRRGGPRSPLHGIPIAHKDLYDVAGLRTTAGSQVLADSEAARRDATVVHRLRRAGAIMLGKTNTHEFAFGVWTPPTSNPWDTSRVPGGSSGGSAAALAGGMTLGATGSDTGGSLRIPSSLCNTATIKPTYGRCSRAGVVPLAWTLDHTGPMARAIEDCALMLNVIAGPDDADPTTADVRVPDFTAGLADGVAGMRIGVPSTVFFDGAEAEVEALVRAAVPVLERLGAEVVTFDPPDTQYAAASAYLVIQLTEPLAAHEHYLRQRPQDYQQQTQVLLGLGAGFHGQHYVRAQRLRTINIQQWLQIFERVDAVLTPTVPRVAPPKQEAMVSGVFELVNYTSAFDFNGFPSVSVPAGFGETTGMPAGLMLSARPFDEQRLLRIAYAYQQATGFGARRPPLDVTIQR